VEDFGDEVKETELTEKISEEDQKELIEDLGFVNSKEQLVSKLQSSEGKAVLEKLGFNNMDELLPALKRLQGNGPPAKEGEKDLSKEGLAMLLNAAKLPADEQNVKASIGSLVESFEAVPAKVRSGEETIEPETPGADGGVANDGDGGVGDDDLEDKSSAELLRVFFSLAITAVGSMLLI
jgi:hypothetical protein